VANLSDFDLDLSYGQEGEVLVRELLTGGQTIEVKRDRRWKDTGNLYVEIECYYTAIAEWKPSGLRVSQAHYWAFVLEEGVIMVPRETLFYAVKSYGRPIECKIEPNLSRGYLITVNDLLTALREF
jgi:hypothetical protein